MGQVVTTTGMPVYGPAPLELCRQYIAQALTKGSKPGFLSISAEVCTTDGGRGQT